MAEAEQNLPKPLKPRREIKAEGRGMKPDASLGNLTERESSMPRCFLLPNGTCRGQAEWPRPHARGGMAEQKGRMARPALAEGQRRKPEEKEADAEAEVRRPTSESRQESDAGGSSGAARHGAVSMRRSGRWMSEAFSSISSSAKWKGMGGGKRR